MKKRVYSTDGGKRYSDIIARVREQLLHEDDRPRSVRDAPSRDSYGRLRRQLEDARKAVKTLEQIVACGQTGQRGALRQAQENMNALTEDLENYLLRWHDAAVDFVNAHQARLRALNRRNREFWKERS